MKLKLKNVRVAFLKVFKAEAVKGSDKKTFGATFLIDPKDPQLKAINEAIAQTAKDKWGAKADAVLKQMKAADKLCLHNGDTKAQYDGFENMMFVSSSTPTRPLAFDRNKQPVAEEDGVLYSGCFVNASLELWAQDNDFGKRINAQLGGVQFVKDGDAFGAGSAADEDDFDDLGEGSDAEDEDDDLV